MTPDRRSDPYLRGRLDAIQRGYERWVAYTLRLLAVLVCIQLGLGALSLYLVGQNQDRSSETRRLLRQVQESREQSVLTTCSQQNARHDKTIAALNAFVDQYKKAHPGLSAKDLREIQQSIQGNVSLINALAPTQDCQKVVDRLVRLKPLR